jgi:NAD(P)-dependent dehydrogenase (short-subunit alcohol dehydrogenase family)
MKEVVLITGCAKGMGHLAAISFAQKDWLVVATDLLSPDFSMYSGQAWMGRRLAQSL